MSFARAAVTAWFGLVFLLTSPLCLLLGSVLYVVTWPFDPDRRALHAFVTGWTFQYLRVWPLWRVRVKGRQHLPPGPCVLVANHQSMADVVAAMGIRYPFKFVSKASLFRLPLVGWLMRMIRYVELERGRHGSTRKMMEDCRFWLGRGMSVLIFPEGTYRTGGELLGFRRGAFQLAIEHRVPVVPVVLRGTRDIIEGDGPWMGTRAKVEVEVLTPIQVTPESDPRELAEEVRALFARELGMDNPVQPERRPEGP